MNAIFFDCFAGISGDMILGALVDAGADLSQIEYCLASLNLDGYEIFRRSVLKKGFAATKIDIIVSDEQVIRHLSDIEDIINSSCLSSTVKDQSLKVFYTLACAEAKVHQTTPDKIHFHEVGAVDSIVDIVACILALEQLKITSFYCSPLPVSTGFVKCEHGVIPLPAPAVAELLKDIPTFAGLVHDETVTPTGAAIIKSLVTSFHYPNGFTIKNVGYGSGSKDFEIANILRVFIGDESSAPELIHNGMAENPDCSWSDTNLSPDSTAGFVADYAVLNNYLTDMVWIIQSNIDDLNPQLYQHLIDNLLLAGALDIFLNQGIMKKNRPAINLHVISPLHKFHEICNIIFSETSAIGIRVRRESRLLLTREFVTVKTVFGPVKIKIAKKNIIDSFISEIDPPNNKDFSPENINISPEYECCRKIALKQNIPLKLVMQTAISAYYEGQIIEDI